MKNWQYEVKRIDERFHLLDRNLDRRFHQTNEVRGALSDLSATMATRRDLDAFKDQYGTAHEGLRQEFQAMGRRLDLQEGRAAGVSTTGRLVATLIATLLSTVLVMVGVYTAVEATSNHHLHPVVTTTVTGP